MNEKYHRLCAQDRKVIYNMNKAAFGQAEIARAIGFSQATVSKELSRNRGKRGYRPKQADDFAVARARQKRSRPKVITGAIQTEVEARILCKHSPDQISGKLALNDMQVSHETIYCHIAEDRKTGGDLWKNLRINSRRRYKRRNKAGRMEKIPNRIDIEDRPEAVELRKRYGDWEADLIQGAAGSGYLLSIYERKCRVGKLYKLVGKTSKETAVGLIMVLKKFEVKTITYDNGLEFAMHGFVNDVLGCDSYFCKPYSSWEKGGVENYNGLVRQYFPKGMDFNEISTDRLGEVEDELNNRPRNVLGYDCPNDFLDQLQVS